MLTMTNIPIQSLPAGEGVYNFADEAHLEAIDKQRLLEDWQRFIAGGFRWRYFTQRLYDFLCHNCAFVARRNRLTFWATYFNAEVLCLRLFLNQFGGNGRSVDFNTHAWLEGPAADLKQALCRETARLYTPLLQVLETLEQKHAELGQLWQTFTLRQALRQAPPPGTSQEGPQRPEPELVEGQAAALAGGIPDPGFPAYCLISENTRNLLAYAAHTTLDQPHLRLKGEGG